MVNRPYKAVPHPMSGMKTETFAHESNAIHRAREIAQETGRNVVIMTA